MRFTTPNFGKPTGEDEKYFDIFDLENLLPLEKTILMSFLLISH
jgi:hypothetical protein